MSYFKQKIKEGETVLPPCHIKVNPIDFENAEGIFDCQMLYSEHLASPKLPISRLQRDLTDSTVLRIIGNPTSPYVISFGIAQERPW